ncbi:hypothetical protein D3C81_1535510 [compost metagenome]
MLDFDLEFYRAENEFLIGTLTAAKLMGWTVKESKNWKQQTILLKKQQTEIKIFIFREVATLNIGEISIRAFNIPLSKCYMSTGTSTKNPLKFTETIKWIQKYI